MALHDELTLPTPVHRVGGEAGEGRGLPENLWVKRDDQVHPLYGGNKARKLAPVLAEARAAGKTRLLTVGAAGSHHVLATALLGRRAGFRVEAVLVPQPDGSRARDVLRASLSHLDVAIPVPSWPGAFRELTRRRGPDAWVLPVGGSSISGSEAYVDAARELANQVVRGEMPTPEVVVVTLGSGGTAAGLAVGLASAGLDVPVVGVSVSDPPRVVALVAHGLVEGLVARTPAWWRARWRLRRAAHGGLTADHRYLGRGYGLPTAAGDGWLGRDVGFLLDPTYTAKTFAAAVDRARGARGVVLYWHTLASSEPFRVHAAVLGGGEAKDEPFPAAFDALFER